MDPARERSHERRRARREAREARFAREDARALAVNPRMWGHAWTSRAVQALVARPATRGPTLWLTGLLALGALVWAIGRAARWW